jgi:hypothetical protein
MMIFNAMVESHSFIFMDLFEIKAAILIFYRPDRSFPVAGFPTKRSYGTTLEICWNYNLPTIRPDGTSCRHKYLWNFFIESLFIY